MPPHMEEICWASNQGISQADRDYRGVIAPAIGAGVGKLSMMESHLHSEMSDSCFNQQNVLCNQMKLEMEGQKRELYH